jgi:2-oxoglutarate-dependent dioxygenase
MKPILEARARFQREGYLAIGPILTEAELEAVRADYDRIFSATEKPASYRNIGARRGEESSEGAVLQIIDMHRLSDAFQTLLFKPEVLDWVEMLLGTPDICLFHDQALYKPAFHGEEVPWHQDNGYWKLEPAEAISLWIALDDADETNGCMRVIPGSHQDGGAGHRASERLEAVIQAEADESRAVAVPLPAGGAMFHHCLTLHNTQPNRSPRQRRAWVMHYMPSGTRRGGEVLTGHLQLRGQPAPASDAVSTS